MAGPGGVGQGCHGLSRSRPVRKGPNKMGEEVYTSCLFPFSDGSRSASDLQDLSK